MLFSMTGNNYRHNILTVIFYKNITEIDIDKKNRFPYIFSAIEGIAP